MNIIEKLTELIGETSSSLPADVERRLKAAFKLEKRGGSAAVILETILQNIRLARKEKTPLCQDTGTLVFYVEESLRKTVTRAAVDRAVARATKKGYLRRNTIDSVTGESFDDNVAAGAPIIRYVEKGRVPPRSVTLQMKGGGSENMSRQYSLPDATLGAGRDLKGVEACVLDAVLRSQGFGCAPGILGVAIGGDRASAYAAAKEALLRPLDEKPPRACTKRERELRALERRILKKANTLGIGPMGLGGRTTLLGVKTVALPRVPASFFVTIAYMCWAARRCTIRL